MKLVPPSDLVFKSRQSVSSFSVRMCPERAELRMHLELARVESVWMYSDLCGSVNGAELLLRDL